MLAQQAACQAVFDDSRVLSHANETGWVWIALTRAGGQSRGLSLEYASLQTNFVEATDLPYGLTAQWKVELTSPSRQSCLVVIAPDALAHEFLMGNRSQQKQDTSSRAKRVEILRRWGR